MNEVIINSATWEPRLRILNERAQKDLIVFLEEKIELCNREYLDLSKENEDLRNQLYKLYNETSELLDIKNNQILELKEQVNQLRIENDWLNDEF